MTVAFRNDPHHRFDPLGDDVEVASRRFALFTHAGFEIHLELPHFLPHLDELRIDAFESLVHAVESLVHPVESPVHPIESLVHAVESFIHTGEPLVDADESLVHRDEALIMAGEPAVDALKALDNGSVQFLNRHGGASILPSS
jgi:hypothetical protein